MSELAERLAREAAQACLRNDHPDHHTSPPCVDCCEDAIRAALDAAKGAVCRRCREGAPLMDPAECAQMGHASRGCHRYEPNHHGHIACEAAAIEAL